MAGAGLPLSVPPTVSSSRTVLFRLPLLLAALPLILAAIAFALQWKGGLDDPVLLRGQVFPGMGSKPARSYSRLGSSSFLAPSVGGRGGSSCVLGQRGTPSFPYLRGSKLDSSVDDLAPKICITTSTSAGLDQLLPWIFYHKVLGVSKFFLFVEGKAAKPDASSVLQTVPGVAVVPRTAELEEMQAKSRIWNETWLSSFFYKPCNYELFVKQTFNMETGIAMARDAGMDWIIHLDTDELVHPAGTKEYSLRQLFSEVPGDVDTVIFTNYESSIESDDIKDPFGEVSLFKKGYEHLTKKMYFSAYKEVQRNNPNYFLTYGNGKSAARVQDHLRPAGAHRWSNYMKTPNEMKLGEAAVLHFTYTKFSDLTSRRDRCGCRPTKEDTKRCFMIGFDRDAFIIASTATEEELLRWYREHVVWTDSKLILKLLRRGNFVRIYAPMTIIQSLRESGVYDSIISAAKTKHLRLNDSAFSGSLFTRKIGDETSRQASRRTLETHDNHEPATPPLSTPTLQDLHPQIF